MGWFLLWHALSTVIPLYGQVCAFPNYFQFTTGGLQSVRNISRMINGNRAKDHAKQPPSMAWRDLVTEAQPMNSIICFACVYFAKLSDCVCVCQPVSLPWTSRCGWRSVGGHWRATVILEHMYELIIMKLIYNRWYKYPILGTTTVLASTCTYGFTVLNHI